MFPSLELLRIGDAGDELSGILRHEVNIQGLGGKPLPRFCEIAFGPPHARQFHQPD